jgi:hypothetical protein
LDKEIFDNIFLGAGGRPGQALEHLLKPFNDGKSSIDLLEVTTLLGLSVNTAFETIKARIRNNGALVIERFKVYPEFVADGSDQLIRSLWPMAATN